MSLTRKLLQGAGVAAGAIGAVAAAAPDSAAGRTIRRGVDRLARDVRYAASSAPGVLYRLAGRHPDPDVSDDVLADRIRSSIGPLERRLDLPHVHVMVEDHVALLHGDVPHHDAAVTVQRAVSRVSGVQGVESHLHIGLIPGDTRPSEAKEHVEPSAALQDLLAAARDAGASRRPAAAVHAVLCGFFDRIPAAERDQVLVHLPHDVHQLVGPLRDEIERPARVKRLSEFVAHIVAASGIPADTAEDVTRAVVLTLRDLVPEEASDVAAVLPTELRQLWQSGVAAIEPADRGAGRALELIGHDPRVEPAGRRAPDDR